MSMELTAETFVQKLQALQSDKELEKVRRFFRSEDNPYAEDNDFIGVRMGEIFKLAKTYTDMPLDEIEALLESPYFEARMGAVSIMDYQVQRKRTPPEQREALYDLYMRRHERINNWDMVDRSAPRVIGGFLVDRPRDVLYELARSENPWERRTAIVATFYFIRKDDLDDTFRIAEILLDDDYDLSHKAVGTGLREAGKQDLGRLLKFLDRHAAQMPRAMLRTAIEKLDDGQREHYRGLGA
jgi:3-methyladenine DNA glycosylase AlkD